MADRKILNPHHLIIHVEDMEVKEQNYSYRLTAA